MSVETESVETEIVVVESEASEVTAAEVVADINEDIDAAPIPLPRVDLNPELLRRIVEGALLAAGKPLAVEDISALFDDSDRPQNDAIRAALVVIAEQCAGRGFELREVASGFRFQVVQEVAPWIARLWEEKPQRYSRALLETLSLIAYRQPITRGDIEDIRGVAVASNIVKTLLERDWVRVVGHKDVPGRPALYATTRKFLDYFNLKNLDDLPTLAEIRDLDSLNAELALEGADTVNIAEQNSSEGDNVAAELAAINEIAGVAAVNLDAAENSDAADTESASNLVSAEAADVEESDSENSDSGASEITRDEVNAIADTDDSTSNDVDNVSGNDHNTLTAEHADGDKIS